MYCLRKSVNLYRRSSAVPTSFVSLRTTPAAS